MKRRILGLMTAFIAAFGLIVTPVTAQAAGLTQVNDSNKVTYGTVTEAQRQVLATMFDFEYYKKTNPELVTKLGDNYQALFDHFCNSGIFEGRTCNPNFDPSVYASAYSDVKDACKDDIVAYYIHYATTGINEDRPITTLKAAAINDITVISLIDSSIVITPLIYRIAEYFGLTDYAKASSEIMKAAYLAAISGKSVVVSSGSGGSANSGGAGNANNAGGANNAEGEPAADNPDNQGGEGDIIIVPENDITDIERLEALGLKPIGSLQVNDEDGIIVYIYANITPDGFTDAAIYRTNFIQEADHEYDNYFFLTDDECENMANSQESCITKTEGFNTDDMVVLVSAAQLGAYDSEFNNDYINGIPDEGVVICSLIEYNPALFETENINTDLSNTAAENKCNIAIYDPINEEYEDVEVIYDPNGDSDKEYAAGVEISCTEDTITVDFGVANGEDDFEANAICTATATLEWN